MKYSAIFALASVAVVAAQSPGADEGRLYYSEPITATVWTAGKTHTVSWTNVCNSQNTGDLDIVLYKGTGGVDDTNQVRVPGIPAIGKLNCLKSKSATVTLPANLTTSNVYSIHVDTEPLQSYSSHFTIKGIDPVTTAPAATSAAATSVAATSATSAPPVSAGASATTPSSPNATNQPNGAGSLKVVGSSAVVVLAAIAMMI